MLLGKQTLSNYFASEPAINTMSAAAAAAPTPEGPLRPMSSPSLKQKGGGDVMTKAGRAASSSATTTPTKAPRPNPLSTSAP